MLYTRTCNSESISDNFFGVSTEESCFFRWKANADNGASVAQELQGACVGRFGSSSDDDLQGMSAVLHAFIGKSALLTTCAPFPVMRLTSAAVSLVSLKSMKAASRQRAQVSITDQDMCDTSYPPSAPNLSHISFLLLPVSMAMTRRPIALAYCTAMCPTPLISEEVLAVITNRYGVGSWKSCELTSPSSGDDDPDKLSSVESRLSHE